MARQMYIIPLYERVAIKKVSIDVFILFVDRDLTSSIYSITSGGVPLTNKFNQVTASLNGDLVGSAHNLIKQ